MDHPAALHRIQVGVPATVEHSSEAGPETAKWVAETTQACLARRHSTHGHRHILTYCAIELHYLRRCAQATTARQGSIASDSAGASDKLCTLQGE